AHDKQRRLSTKERIGAGGEQIMGEQGNENARIQIDAHRSQSSLIRVTNVPASSPSVTRPTLCAASQSTSARETERAGAGTGFNSTTGRPWWVMTTSSPLSARSINSGSRFL